MTDAQVGYKHGDPLRAAQATSFMHRVEKFKNDLHEGTHFELANLRDGNIITRKYRVAEKHAYICTCERSARHGSYMESFTWPELCALIIGKPEEDIPSLTGGAA